MSLMASAWINHHRALEAGELCQYFWIKGRLSSGQFGDITASGSFSFSANGGTDEGAPGPRPADSTTFYGAYLRDPTGNKICVYCKP
jgi:hypothetical protein